MTSARAGEAPPLVSLRFAGDSVLHTCNAGLAELEPGMVGGAVARVQQALMDLRYRLGDCGPDGVFGDETAEAVSLFNSTIGEIDSPRV
ncbi:MAG TPA: hypothetical protein VM754_12505, partial [Actinomycetota bacterium]|nr:hypothetical protein [Actinomycetota bacterium]